MGSEEGCLADAFQVAAVGLPVVGLAGSWLLVFGVHGGTALIVNGAGQLSALVMGMVGSPSRRPALLIIAVALSLMTFVIAVRIAGPSQM